MWAKGTVVAPRLEGQPNTFCSVTNINNNDKPVMIEGITRGAATNPENSNRPRNRPIRVSASAASVPNTVANDALTNAIRRLNKAASMSCSF